MRPLLMLLTFALLGAVTVTSPTAAVPGQTAGSTTVQHYPVVLGLGDSVTAGTACNCEDFITRFADAISTSSGHRSVGINLGVPGSTSADLESDLDNSDKVRNDVREAGTVIITIGANDLNTDLQDEQAGACDESCYGPDIAEVRTRVGHILQQIRALRGGQPTKVFVTNYWNVFADGDVAIADSGQQQLAWSDAVTRQANTALCSAADLAGAVCVDLYSAFKGTGEKDPTRLLASDGDHPNAAGSKMITAALLAAAGN
ncbi:lysophospholipase L1-like esterase [Antricoccus suffuscus]|uniref:Lysophospholipase L1-like esterase n=2 Tax=Antricoccus suffuscus TaxID=1629062 RepID=A0A2T1A5V6_9ACTN|nr:lysophospholipase L1-like esterase [Antricoccus suffuscus]